ncbi:MAG: DNA-directed RNA polymerase subunit alpha [Candidatus Amesbacteria bacterium GW2011_GWA1_47_16]|uniref:DNA-directed RNA polymerase subunit alpha n=4 Tax=Candidatus Amesiibacteriota TaxID=1752730 RepID=A0A0G1V5E6_9BACT|nr:MAG: DNA-directed RNA polymerase subunit alpha [Candidatus Amesbacteria bacterium GW2011_GWA1_47_16]KKU65170.1 MAG: DNA-directed RNA polymerase subunit alpha [Candidatus Amesbacteria bacterium GW2011_GWC1_47_15]KKU98470.1 MAG: DNA-directed RNA polymerase subunit alpha [Candidatus Amesbacteria bacterium GW2011_GWB1_48_13]OGD00315.1 MAG: DNA-directed RNA polymerase subunit alpha [Candidatus Amesbacteria bacterium RIFCSPLOWO2_01_FULL_47_33]OGD00887.1 MAG: DNA-directed RNA polymerase subunit alp
MVQPQFTISTEKTDSPNFGRFVIEPLPQGYGTTLGNALRRVLYTSIPGAAITSVYIPGVNHQFTTIDGAREDVVQMVLALKQLRPAYAGDKPAKITLSVKGPGVITAGQFETPPDVKISNPELVIANLTDKNTKLEMEATVESGFGYSPAEERKSSTLGVIPTDASFTPVIRVNYEIQDTRVGRVTNFDKLIMEILTDGTITPQSALTSASQTLVDYFSAVVTPQSPSNAAGLPSAFHQAAGSNIAIEELDLPTRIANALQKAGFESVADLLSVPRTDLAKVKNLGGKSVKIIEAALSERGFELS